MTETPITETSKDGNDALLGEDRLRQAQDATSARIADHAAEDARTDAAPEQDDGLDEE